MGILLGAAVGLVLLTVQGQRTARTDLAPFFNLYHQALSTNDSDLFRSLLAPEADWAAQLPIERDSYLALVDADSGPPRVRRVRLVGLLAEVEIESSFRGQSYRRLESVRRSDGQWRLARSLAGDWGDAEWVEEGAVRLTYRHRDAALAALLPEIQAVVRAFCARYAPPAPCQIDLKIEPDPALKPFIPGRGAQPQPSLYRYSIAGQTDTGLITINGIGQEALSSALRDELLRALRDVSSSDDLFAWENSPPEAQIVTAQRLTERFIPVTMISPRLAGLAGDQPHPLWRLALYEAIGDAIMRRALGPITGEEEAVFQVWALAQGDVTVWAERFSGVTAPVPTLPADLDPVGTGRALAANDASARPAARQLALGWHAGYGEAAVLDLLQRAGDALVTRETLIPLQPAIEKSGE